MCLQDDTCGGTAHGFPSIRALICKIRVLVHGAGWRLQAFRVYRVQGLGLGFRV